MDAISGEVTVEFRSHEGARPPHRVVVTLPTFRRPEHLEKTLRSLCEQNTEHRFAVVVMDNDDTGREGAAAARPFFLGGLLEGLVIIAHERGNCSAYNAGWKTALGEFPGMEFLLVIDDDECADPQWLARLVETAQETDADAVGGPQIPVFADERGAKLANHPVFEPHYDATGPVPILYSSGNVLLRRRLLEAMGPPFLDTAFNFIGGGDSDFYSRCREKGFSFAWCQEAPVYETVPQRRTEFSWLQARALREGALSAIIERRRDSSFKGRARSLAKSLALLVASPVRGSYLAWQTGSFVTGLYRPQVALGRLLGELGIVNEQYRRPEEN
ncbi:glycosyltransferase family 2 protein [Consotaella salsifontis]|uniref:Glycosyltransferase, GT2 family n=1 Tax=Consotaella salsifontis TaxID=1365950 RepID=A0A1T4Q2V8_9HYPH|nr:glycosyltransferase family 2 protein [Consotaella salsifontis]SJZ98165.1 Glycosyltransferase, GT2 family [Consotaella salsifontis]